MSSDVHVTYENIRELLIGLKGKIKEELNNVDLTEDQKAIIEKGNKIVTDGDGKSFLADDGTYKEVPVDDINNIESKIQKVIELFNITSDEDGTLHYEIKEITDAVNKTNMIQTTGNGDKILADNGEYISPTDSSSYRVMNESEIQTLMGEIEEL